MCPIYLDYNATTPVAREVADTMKPYLYEFFGNPSSSHSYGAKTKMAVEMARQQVADLIAAQPGEVIFTSGGTEANNYAIRGYCLANREHGRHIITSAVEHPAVMEVCKALQTEGFTLSILAVDQFGMVDPAELEAAIRPETLLVTIMHANNEVGTIQAIKELARITHKKGAAFHSDAAQSVGKIPIFVNDLGVDLLSIAGHKLYAPKGVGVLYVRSGIKLSRLMFGASHKSNRRPGTENVLEIVGFGKAAEIAKRDFETNFQHYNDMRDRLHQGLLRELGGEKLRLNGHPEKRLPNTLSISFRNIEANTLLSEIGDEVAASAGAACHADQVDVSVVLQAMQVPIEWAMGTVRFSVGRETDAAQIDRAVAIISSAVKRLQPRSALVEPVFSSNNEDIKLTQFTHGMGCACKIQPQLLEAVLKKFPVAVDPAVLVGFDTSDDAAVYRLRDDLALVETVDFFTPIVDDPYWFGAISAANALSDIYAMGATPLFGLNIVGFPTNRLPQSVLERILEGAFDKTREAGISILGGHTIEDNEPKFGLAVTGVVHPEKIVRNNTAQVGDKLILTKPLGFGILATALKRGLLDKETIQEATQWMAALNRSAAEAMIAVGVHACTDITGFGLLGHLFEMTVGSGVEAVIEARTVPVLPSARRLAQADIIPGGTRNNLEYFSGNVRFDSRIAISEQYIFADAQTSGGLLISVAAEKSTRLLEELEKNGVKAAVVIGEISTTGTGQITVRG